MRLGELLEPLVGDFDDGVTTSTFLWPPAIRQATIAPAVVIVGALGLRSAARRFSCSTRGLEKLPLVQP
jgi:hypothetical protein